MKQIIYTILIVTLTILFTRLFLNKTKEVKHELNISKSVCDEVMKSVDLEPVQKFEGTPAKVNFKGDKWLYQFRTTVSEQVASGPNFAGHFTFVQWGCGTNCLANAIIDSITGNRVLTNNVVFENLKPSFNINSRLLVFNPKDDLVNLKGKKIEEIIKQNDFIYELGREYYELVENSDGYVWLNKLCSENILDGIYAY